jgi:carbonic anhydrase
MERVREVSSSQRSFAAFLGCADSRVPIEMIFNQGFGDLFVTRVAGNIASSENAGSLEFGTEVPGARVLYVPGHTHCGAVTAAVRGADVPGQISALFQHICPAIRVAAGDAEELTVANARHQAVILLESSPVIASDSAGTVDRGGGNLRSVVGPGYAREAEFMACMWISGCNGIAGCRGS